MKNIFFLVILFISITSNAQQDAWVYFNSKPNSQTFLDNPLSMLTQRALDRRATQNIALDMLDVPVYQPFINQVEAATGITVLAKSKWLNAVHVRGQLTQIQALTTLSFVDHLDFANKNLNRPNVTESPKKRLKPVNKTFETLTNFNYGNSSNQIQMIGGHLLHQQGYTGQGKIIAIMDGGFPGVDTASPFERLRTNNKILGGYDFVNRDNNFYTGISHGTLVLSSMGGYVDNQLVGTAPDASYYLFITEDGDNEEPLEESLWVEAAEEADRLGVDVINTSLGYTTFDNPDYDHTYEDMDGQTTFISRGLNAAYSRGMICVNSAGNSGNSDWYYISTPADATYAYTVGAVNASGNTASFSSHGPSFDGRVKPDAAAQGVACVLSDENGSIVTANGTSFSGPITAGMMATLWQALPNATNSELMQFVRESASQFSNPDDEQGYGIPNFNQALINGNLSVTNFKSDTLVVYPNPFQNQIFVALPNGISTANLKIVNSLGQIVVEKSVLNETPILLQNLQSGIYLYIIESNSFSKMGKIIKN